MGRLGNRQLQVITGLIIVYYVKVWKIHWLRQKTKKRKAFRRLGIESCLFAIKNC